MANAKIRMELWKANMPQWALADALGCAPETLCRKLRHELPKEEQNRLIRLIKEKADKKA